MEFTVQNTKEKRESKEERPEIHRWSPESSAKYQLVLEYEKTNSEARE